jgi:hypothetical protein
VAVSILPHYEWYLSPQVHLSLKQPFSLFRQRPLKRKEDRVNVLVHAIDGRLRVRIDSLKKNPQAAGSMSQSLLKVAGVKKVMASPITGSVLVHYDPWRISQADLLELFGLSEAIPSPSQELKNGAVEGSVSGGLGRSVADVVVRVMLEVLCYYAARRLFAVRL